MNRSRPGSISKKPAFSNPISPTARLELPWRADYNALTIDVDKPLVNRALAGTYPPGSTVKPFISLVALEHVGLAGGEGSHQRLLRLEQPGEAVEAESGDDYFAAMRAALED